MTLLTYYKGIVLIPTSNIISYILISTNISISSRYGDTHRSGVLINIIIIIHGL